jgi:hypothetical protein
MAVCAVRYEPVSTCNSLLAGNCREFRRFWLPRADSDPIFDQQNQWLSSEIPYATEQGIFEHLAGNFRKRPFLTHLFGGTATAICSHRQSCR